MNRELKFRIWNKTYTEKFNIVIEGKLKDVFKHCGDVDCSENYTIQQYTGLKDKTGNPIYEGDVVSLKIPLNDQPILFNATIVWDYYQYAFEIHNSENTVISVEDWVMITDNPWVNCEIIGNIFES